MTAVWIAAVLIFLFIEALSAAMTSIWFSAGALAALAASALGGPLWVQLALFAAVSGVCFALLYPRLKKWMGKDRHPTNADRVLGRRAVVTQRVDDLAGTGAVSVDGRTWTARSASGEILDEGAIVTAERIEGVKLIVSPVRETADKI